jgi:hypothetical protein
MCEFTGNLIENNLAVCKSLSIISILNGDPNQVRLSVNLILILVKRRVISDPYCYASRLFLVLAPL